MFGVFIGYASAIAVFEKKIEVERWDFLPVDLCLNYADWIIILDISVTHLLVISVFQIFSPIVISCSHECSFKDYFSRHNFSARNT